MIFIKNLTSLYTEEYARVNGEEYNKMIKQEIDDALLERLIVQMARYGAGDVVKKFFKKINIRIYAFEFRKIH